MALGAGTFSAAGGAVSELFAGFGAKSKAELQAQGMRITAEGTLITAQGTRLNAQSLRTKAGGDLAEADNYDLASGLAEANKAYTEQSTRLQQSQTDRQIFQATGAQRAGAAGAGFAEGGSAGDLLRDSASQGALAKATLAQQGVITEAGYEEQSQSYKTLSGAARATAASEYDMATKTEGIADQETAIAGQQAELANKTQSAGEEEMWGHFAGGLLKGAAAVASIGLAPFTGGASLAVGAAVTGGLEGLEAIH